MMSSKLVKAQIRAGDGSTAWGGGAGRRLVMSQTHKNTSLSAFREEVNKPDAWPKYSPVACSTDGMVWNCKDEICIAGKHKIESMYYVNRATILLQNAETKPAPNVSGTQTVRALLRLIKLKHLEGDGTYLNQILANCIESKATTSP